MPYSKTAWVNGSAPALNATDMNKIEAGIADARGTGYIVVASADSTTAVQNSAQFVCDGIADQVEINLALVAAGIIPGNGGAAGGKSGGRVQLTGGQFNTTGSIIVPNATTLQGAGNGTVIQPTGITTATGAGSNIGVIKNATVNDHSIRICDLYIDGNAAAGGINASGIVIDNTGSAINTYPSVSPDSDHRVENVTMYNFGINGGSGTRHGVWFVAGAGGGDNSRGNITSHCQIRQLTGDGVRYENSSDGFILGCHVGGTNGNGYNVSGGNMVLTGCKSYFADVAAFSLSSGRSCLSGCTSQDSNIGFLINGQPAQLSGCMADTSSAAGFQISSNDVRLDSCTVFVRGGGRYATQTRGIYWDAAYSGTAVMANITPANITTPVVGTPANGFVRIVNGTTGALAATVG